MYQNSSTLRTGTDYISTELETATFGANRRGFIEGDAFFGGLGEYQIGTARPLMGCGSCGALPGGVGGEAAGQLAGLGRYLPRTDPMFEGLSGFGAVDPGVEVEGTVTLRAEFLNYTAEQWGLFGLTFGAGVIEDVFASDWQSLVGRLASLLDSSTGDLGIMHMIARHTCSDFMSKVAEASGAGTLFTSLSSIVGSALQSYWADMQSYVADWLDPSGGSEEPTELSPAEQAAQQKINDCLGLGGSWDGETQTCISAEAGARAQCRNLGGDWSPDTGCTIKQTTPRVITGIVSGKPMKMVSADPAVVARMHETMKNACTEAGGTWDTKYNRCVSANEIECLTAGGSWNRRTGTCEGGKPDSEKTGAAVSETPWMWIGLVGLVLVGGIVVLNRRK